jgi:hypothetical protein
VSLTKKLLVHVSPEMHAALKEHSSDCERPVSAIVRRALEMYLDPNRESVHVKYGGFPRKSQTAPTERPREY